MKKISAIVAFLTSIASFLFTSPVSAAGINISGNGYGSYNDVYVNHYMSDSQSQYNSSANSSYVSSYTNTGGNSADYNTGGDNTVYTGDAATRIDIYNGGNSNTATDNNYSHMEDLGSIMLNDNGAFSTNLANIFHSMTQSLTQSNTSSNYNTVQTDTNTGNNHADGNTNFGWWWGNNTSTVQSGYSNTDVYITNDGNTNFAGQ
jgi:hypothetical protein